MKKCIVKYFVVLMKKKIIIVLLFGAVKTFHASFLFTFATLSWVLSLPEDPWGRDILILA